MAQNIVMAGFGPQVRHQYHPIFERLSARLPTRIKLLIDLKDQETTILNYLAERRNQPECILLLDPSQRVSDRMPPEVTEFLERIHRCDRIDKILVATEPKGHMGYILWALEHDVDVALEKPITSPLLNTCEPSSAGRILEDYLEIEKALNHSRSRAVVMINRRHHHGYNLIRNYLRRFLSEFGIPITYLEVYHSDGMWNMPDEFHYRENHPYKYGYGKLLHSGYHHVDLFMWLAQLNQELSSKRPDTMEVLARSVSVHDFMHQVDEENYRKLFRTDKFNPYFKPEAIEATRKFGETDVCVLTQLKRDNAVMTTGVLNLLQTSFSQRDWTETRDRLYNKQTGRMTHERLTVQVGHLLNIQAQVYDFPTEGNEGNLEGERAKGFHITICRNSALVGGPAFEDFTLPNDSLSEHDGQQYWTNLARQAREEMVALWLAGSRTNSELRDQHGTIQLLAKIYESMFRQNSGLSPMTAFSL